MTSNKFVRTLTLGIVLTLMLSFVVGVGAQGDKILIDSEAMGASDLPTLDPSLATDSSSIAVIESIFVPLTRLNEITTEPEPGMATDWEVSEDGLTYTFSIMEGVPWVEYVDGEVVEVTDENGDVRFVTAHDFAYGIRRTLDPRTAADYAGVLAPWVAGGSEIIEAGEMDDEALDEMLANLEIEVVDDYTLSITTSRAASFVPSIFGMWITNAQPSWLIEEVGDQWILPENIQTYGPFTLAEWNNDENVLIVKNPFWEGTEYVPAPALDGVDFRVSELSTSLANFEAGTVDVIAPPPADLARIQADPDLSETLYIGPSKYTYYYGFDVTEAPVNDVRVRRALSMAIDRQLIIDRILQGGQSPAAVFTYPTVVAAPTVEEFGDELGIRTNLEMAQQLFQEYLDDTGQTVDDLPPITLMFNENETHATIAQAVQQMWAEAFGIEVQLASQEWGVFLQTRAEDPPAIFRSAWGWDYPDANSFLYDVFHRTSANNDTRWNDAEFDTVNEEFNSLLEEAVQISDPAARAELYAQAENILVNEVAAIAPIYHYTTLRMTQPDVERTYSVLGNERYEKWDIAE